MSLSSLQILSNYFSNFAKVLKKEEEERKAREGSTHKVVNTGKLFKRISYGIFTIMPMQ